MYFPSKKLREREKIKIQKLFYFSLSFYLGSGNDIQIVSNLFTILPKNKKHKQVTNCKCCLFITTKSNLFLSSRGAALERKC